MTLNWKKLHVLTVFTVKMDETLKLLNALRINQEHIASQMNIQGNFNSCKVNNDRNQIEVLTFYIFPRT